MQNWLCYAIRYICPKYVSLDRRNGNSVGVITAPPPPILDASSPEAYKKNSQAVILYLEQTRINPLLKKCQTEFLLSREEKQEAKAFNSLKYLLEEGNKREMNGLNANQLMDYVKAKIENAKK